MKAGELSKHISGTYFYLRAGLFALAIALPLTLWLGGLILADMRLLGSMSAYYHGGGGALRDVFVGILCALSALLILYKGFTHFEDYALNLAGIFLILVAIVPMDWECGDTCQRFSLHGTFAVLFFLCIAYVSIFRATDTVGLIKDPARKKRYARTYKILGLLMIASPAIAVILTVILQANVENRSTIFFIEAAGAYAFAAYWIVKSREIAVTDSEKLAIEGALRTDPNRPAKVFKEIAIDQTLPVLK